MTAIPPALARTLVGVFAGYVVAFAVVMLPGRAVLTDAVALALFGLGAVVGLSRVGEGRLPLWRAIAVAGAAALLPLLGAVGLDPRRDGYGSGAWYVGGVACLVLVLLWRRREVLGWSALGVLVLHTVLWAGAVGLTTFGVLAAVLLLAVLAGGGWALRRAEQDLERYASVARETLQQRAAQDAYESVRQQRLLETARIGGPMLQRIVAAGGRLDAAERFEARVMEQTVRDEIRGRRLLDDAVREQVLRLRRAGAAVQVNDDGGLNDLDADDVAALLGRVAEALAGLSSDRVIIRTAPKESAVALTVVAMSLDPVAAALGLDDEDDRVDLWLELERPAGAATRT